MPATGPSGPKNPVPSLGRCLQNREAAHDFLYNVDIDLGSSDSKDKVGRGIAGCSLLVTSLILLVPLSWNSLHNSQKTILQRVPCDFFSPFQYGLRATGTTVGKGTGLSPSLASPDVMHQAQASLHASSTICTQYATTPG